ncbi:MAG: polyprenyl synthetase family protein [Planctomycetota bacterium]|nr:MAG: polyprenyl synthetase family protein [Planctomycetota bacterium]
MPSSHAHIAERIEHALRGYASACGLSGGLLEAVEYALLGGGKRLRPVLAWRCAEAVGGDGERSLPGGVAVELVHAFSLVHDDLPALDNDDMRRGRPTLHIHAGEPMALLAGDAMLTLAFDAADRLCTDEPADLRLALIREVVEGTRSMIVGQVYDTLGGLGAGLSDLERLETVHRNKTGALIRAACRLGAMLGAGTPNDDGRLGAITGFAERLGLIFQIVDDVLDVEGSAAVVGKATGKDADAGKLTYPGVLGVDGSRAEIRRLQDEAEALIAPLGEPARPLIDLSRAMAQRDR